MTYGLEPTAFH